MRYMNDHEIYKEFKKYMDGDTAINVLYRPTERVIRGEGWEGLFFPKGVKFGEPCELRDAKISYGIKRSLYHSMVRRKWEKESLERDSSKGFFNGLLRAVFG